MNKFISSLLFLCLFSITGIRAERDSTFTPFPQEYPNDTLPQIQKIPSREERRWLPDNLIFQYAGSIGICSAGIGWEYGKRHWETDLLLGIVPKAYGRPAMLSTTIKQVYTPGEFRLPRTSVFSHCTADCSSTVSSMRISGRKSPRNTPTDTMDSPPRFVFTSHSDKAYHGKYPIKSVSGKNSPAITS